MAVNPVDGSRPPPAQEAPQQSGKSKGAIPPQDSGQKTSQPGSAQHGQDSVSIGPKRGKPA